jgi:hypothetical protein
MPETSVERKTESPAKTVKTVENGCQLAATGEKSTYARLGWT